MTENIKKNFEHLSCKFEKKKTLFVHFANEWKQKKQQKKNSSETLNWMKVYLLK